MSASAATTVRRSHLLAGLGDAGFASAGTFLVGVIAVRELSAGALAVYVVLSSATIFSMPLPRQLAYYPAQLGANLQPVQMSPVLRGTMRQAARPSLLASAIVVAAGISLIGRTSVAQLVALTITAVLFTVVSPLQDHMRGNLHVAGRHERAAICSVALASVVAVTMVATLLVELPPEVVACLPFGALVLGNLVSTAVGILLLRGVPRHAGYLRAGLGERSRYLVIELGIQGAWLGCNYVVLLLLGTRALADLETARISASPVLILAAGVSTFMVAALLRQVAAEDQDGRKARRLLLGSFAIVLIGAALWAAVLALALPLVESALNRSVDLGLALLRIGAFVLDGCSGLTSAVLLAIKHSRAAVVTALSAAVLGLVGTAALAPAIGPAALPIAQGTGMAARLAASLGVSRSRFR